MEVDDKIRVLTLRLLKVWKFHNPCQVEIQEITECPGPNFLCNLPLNFVTYGR